MVYWWLAAQANITKADDKNFVCIRHHTSNDFLRVEDGLRSVLEAVQDSPQLHSAVFRVAGLRRQTRVLHAPCFS
jgi:hypothetical protein